MNGVFIAQHSAGSCKALGQQLAYPKTEPEWSKCQNIFYMHRSHSIVSHLAVCLGVVRKIRFILFHMLF